MAGLMNKQQMGEGPAKPSAAERNPLNDPNAEEGSNVSPEEQAAYDTVVTNGMQLIYNEQAMPQLLQNIAGDGNPVEGLANALATVFMRLEDSAQKAGQPIPAEVKLPAATELLEQMVELAEAAGIHEYTPEEMESATLLAVDTYRVAKQEEGTLPVDEIKEDFAMLQQADQQGNLDEIVPGASEFAAKSPQAEQPPKRGLMG